MFGGLSTNPPPACVGGGFLARPAGNLNSLVNQSVGANQKTADGRVVDAQMQKIVNAR